MNIYPPINPPLCHASGPSSIRQTMRTDRARPALLRINAGTAARWIFLDACCATTNPPDWAETDSSPIPVGAPGACKRQATD